jgi:hypothetical protein
VIDELAQTRLLIPDQHSHQGTKSATKTKYTERKIKMKKKLLILLVVISAALLTAAYAWPSPVRTIEGTLRYGLNACGPPDYVTNEAMDEVYLTGASFPTRGQYQGCHIWASGIFITSKSVIGSSCRIFQVESMRLDCW